ncbi:MAG: SufE family protein [Paludibacteraceae bacterium]|nr:SufE family protein [Paludibacteraceae bacterium]
MNTELKERQDEFVANLSQLGEWADKFTYLIETGDALPEMPKQMKVPQNLIYGCTSRTYFRALPAGGVLRIYGWSNSPVMCGILEAVRSIFDGLAIDPEDEVYFHTASGLIDHLTPQRRGALVQIINRIQSAADDL